MLKDAARKWQEMTVEDRTLELLKKELWTRTALIAISGLLTVVTTLGAGLLYLAGREFGRMSDSIHGLQLSFQAFSQEYASTKTEVRYLRERIDRLESNK
jgi:hypothetical protein